MTTKLTLSLLLISAGLGGAQDRLADMLRKGIVEEETNQNLNAAIQTYESILAQFDEERKAAATALFRLAECYRKQGKNDQAIAAYKRVLQEFSDQTKLAEQSRNHLTKTFKLSPQQAAGPLDSQALAARASYRSALQRQLDLATELLQRAEREHDLGTARLEEVLKAQQNFSELLRALAATDGLALPPTAPSRSESLIWADMEEAQAKLSTLQKLYDANTPGVTLQQILAVQARFTALLSELSAAEKAGPPSGATKRPTPKPPTPPQPLR